MSLLHGVGSGLGGAGDSGGALGSFYSHTIDQSLRFDAEGYLTRNTGEAGNTTVYTTSFWVKRSGLTSHQYIFSAGPWNGGNNFEGIRFVNDDTLRAILTVSNSTVANFTTNAKFRDVSAWYHIVWQRNGQAYKIYVNGTEQTYSTSTFSSNPNGYLTADTEQLISGRLDHAQDLDGYLAEFHFVDGSALDPTSFGETKDGVWIPKEYSGSYGTNGFYLPFQQDRTVGASAFFSDDGNSYVKFSNSSYYNIAGSDDFTIEFFMWPTVKQLGENAYIFGYYAGTGGPYLSVQLIESGTPRFYVYYGNGTFHDFTYTAGAVEAGRWHHVVVNRASGNLEMFLDGARIGSTKTSNTTSWTGATQVRIGHAGSDSSAVAYDGYLSNVRMVVGSAVYSAGSSITVPTSTLTAVTNTQLLALTTTTLTADASSNSVTGTLHGSGYYATDRLSPFPNGAFNEDASGNSNDFSANYLLDTDVVLDSPTNNFATMNPLYHSSSKAVLSEGNLKAATAGFVNAAHGYGAVSTFVIPKDKKIYIEVEDTGATGDNWFAGFATQSSLEAGPSSTTIGSTGSVTAYNRSVYVNGTENDYGSSAGLGGLGVAKLAAGDILGCAIDGATGKVWFHRNGTYFKTPTTNDSGTTGDPAGGNHEIGTITDGTTEDVFFVLGGGTSADNVFVNFGQDNQNVASANADGEGIGTFEYAPPTGYVALCSSNLTAPAIGPTQSSQADDHFNTVLFTGDNSSSNAITGVGFQPDLVWIKQRTDATSNQLFDVARGATKGVRSDTTTPRDEYTNTNTLTSFDSDGFTVGSANAVNGSSDSLVSWNWKAGGSASSNSDGSITSSVSVNTIAGFSIVSFTTDGVTSGTVGHGLGVQPQLIIGKTRNHDVGWYIQTPLLATNLVGAFDTAAWYNPGINHYNDTHPTADVFSVGGYMADHADLTNPSTKIVYCFANVEGYSKVGTYVGNGSNYSNGAFIFTGFRPAFVVVKASSTTGDWVVTDNKRASSFNGDTARLYWTTSAAETSYQSNRNIELFSNGFAVHGNSASSTTNRINQSASYIYLAFAEAPFKFANAR